MWEFPLEVPLSVEASDPPFFMYHTESLNGFLASR